jgi:hypothetical protein
MTRTAAMCPNVKALPRTRTIPVLMGSALPTNKFNFEWGTQDKLLPPFLSLNSSSNLESRSEKDSPNLPSFFNCS